MNELLFLGKTICENIIQLHALIGCDTTSYFYMAGEIGFKVEGSWNTEKYCRPPWVADKKNAWILDTLEWLKQ